MALLEPVERVPRPLAHVGRALYRRPLYGGRRFEDLLGARVLAVARAIERWVRRARPDPFRGQLADGRRNEWGLVPHIAAQLHTRCGQAASILNIRMSQGLEKKRGRSVVPMVVAAAAMFAAASPPAVAGEARAKQPTPVIFVHGNSGSAQQFETNAMRLTSNGFPQNRIFAYEYDTLASNNDAAIANLDGFIADVKERDRRRSGRHPRPLARHDRDARYLGDAGAGAVGSPLRQLRRPDQRRRRPAAFARSRSGARATRAARSAAPRTSTSRTRPTPR